MRRISLLVLVLLSSTASAKVINIEFKFTPFVGDAKKADHVETVPGLAQVFVNNLPIAQQPVNQQDVPVMFEAREIAPAVWVPIESLGGAVRKGQNTIRIEFEPENAKTPYRAQLRWASVTDQTTEKSDVVQHQATNQTGEGVDEKQATGKVVFQREFVADFAADLPWHHFPSVTQLSDDDKQRLTALVKERADAFKPDFAGVYTVLKGDPRMDVGALQTVKCLDKAYGLGVRIVAAPPEFVTTGGPAVVLRGKEGNLYVPADPSVFDKIEGEEMQMCLSMALVGAYPPQLVVVRDPSGKWEAAY